MSQSTHCFGDPLRNLPLKGGACIRKDVHPCPCVQQTGGCRRVDTDTGASVESELGVTHAFHGRLVENERFGEPHTGVDLQTYVDGVIK